jgi:hypothetical protein
MVSLGTPDQLKLDGDHLGAGTDDDLDGFAFLVVHGSGTEIKRPQDALLKRFIYTVWTKKHRVNWFVATTIIGRIAYVSPVYPGKVDGVKAVYNLTEEGPTCYQVIEDTYGAQEIGGGGQRWQGKVPTIQLRVTSTASTRQRRWARYLTKRVFIAPDTRSNVQATATALVPPTMRRYLDGGLVQRRTHSAPSMVPGQSVEASAETSSPCPEGLR